MPNIVTIIIQVFSMIFFFSGLAINESIICPLQVATYPTVQTQKNFDSVVKLLGSLNDGIVFIKRDFSKPECQSVPFGVNFEKSAGDMQFSTNLTMTETHDIFNKVLTSDGWVHDQNSDADYKNNGQFVSLNRLYKKKIYFRDFTLDVHFGPSSPPVSPPPPIVSGSVSVSLREK